MTAAVQSPIIPPDPPEIDREHVIRMLVSILEGSTRIVALEGAEGMGKTTLLRQFARRHASQTVALFVSAASRFAYSPIQLRMELCERLAELVKGDRSDYSEADEAEVQRLTYALARRAASQRQVYYFLLDGIEEIPETEDTSRSQILSLLPFGIEHFRFIISGPAEDLQLLRAAKRTLKAYPLGYLSEHECERFLGELSLTTSEAHEIYAATGGVPGRLAIVRRLLVTSSNRTEVIARLSQALPELFELEWAAADPSDELQVLVLAILAHEARSYSAAELGGVLQVQPERIRAKVQSLSFVNEDSNGLFSFQSESFRKFVGDRLSALRPKVNDLFIDYYFRNPDSDEALANLSTYFTSAHRLRDLVQYLSPERFARLYQRAPNMAVVKRAADHGIAAARELGEGGALVRFIVQKCTLEEISQSDTAVSEVRARVALGQYDTALALAGAGSRLESRFRLLAAIARVRRELGLPDDAVLREQILNAYGQLEPTQLGPIAIEAAIDLFYSAPDLAIDLVTRSTGADSAEDSLDWALATLAIQAHLVPGDPNAPGYADSISERIQNPAAKRLSTEAGFVLGGLSAADAIKRAQSLDGATEQLYVLRHWMRANRDRADAVDVLEYGLAAAIRSTTFTPDARTFRELSLCLPYVQEVQRASYFIDLLDGQRTLIQRAGPSEEFLRLQLLIARSEWRHDRTAAWRRFEHVYNECARLPDIVTRTAVMARMASMLTWLDPGREHELDLHVVVEEELDQCVERLLAFSADHEEACRGVVDALALRKPTAAIGVIERLNVEWRRDRIYKHCVTSMTDGPAGDIDGDAVQECLRRIVDPRMFDEALSGFMSRMRRRDLPAEVVLRLEPVARGLGQIADASKRSFAAADVVCVCGRESLLQPLKAWALDQLRDTYRAIEDAPSKLDLGFEIVVRIAESAPEVASELVDGLNKLKASLAPQDEEAAGAAALGLRLAIRAFAGLLATRADTSEDLERLTRAIHQCGSLWDRVTLLSVLALRCRLAERQEECSKIVQQELVPLLYQLEKVDRGAWCRMVISTAPALFMGASGTARTVLSDLPDIIRDEALREICLFVFRKVPPSDPFHPGAYVGFEITFEEANTLIDLMGEMTADAPIYDVLVSLIDSGSGATFGHRWNRHTKAELVRKLEALVAEKFPAPRWIRHEGYSVVSRAHINRLRAKQDAVAAEKYAQSARAIPNVSDRAYVLSVVAATTQDKRERQALLQEARAVADSIPILADRLDRYYSLASLMARVDEELAKDVLRSAMQLSRSGTGETIEERRRSLVDLAYNIDPDFASSVVENTDDDPARRRLDRQLRLYQVRDSLAEKRPTGDYGHLHAHEVARAAWMKLGLLNARRIGAVTVERALPALEYAASLQLSVGYPIFAWFTENAVRKSASRGDAHEYVLPLFESFLRGAELAVRAGTRSSAQPARLLSFDAASLEQLGHAEMIGDGERSAGVQRLREWLAGSRVQQLWIVDPYFDPDSVELLSVIRDATEDCEVTVVSSQTDLPGSSYAPIEDAYKRAWRRVAAGAPPATRVILASTKSGKFPVHDRWWLASDGGVHLGTSYNGIGSRVSTVRVLSDEEAKRKLLELLPYFAKSRVEFEGERLAYTEFTL